MSTVNARNRRSRIPSFASKSVQFQQAPARQIACMAGERLIPPTPRRKGCITSFSTYPMRGEQGMQVEEVKECDNQAFWWI
jgi:hypothetical protein